MTRIALLSRAADSEAASQSAATMALAAIHETACLLVRTIGEVVWAINPKHDSSDALANYLSDYAREFLSTAGIRCRLEVPLDLPAHNLSAQVRHNLLPAFKETLTNVVMHAGTSEVRIRLVPTADFFTLHVEDDGQGLPEDAGCGHGLANMNERMTGIGGNCTVSRAAGGGGRVAFTVPSRQCGPARPRRTHHAHSNT